jgi:GAF domain-containing protein
MQARTDELRAVSDAVLSVASQLDVDVVLQRLVDQARSLLGARYAALGIPDGEGGFSRFLVSGMDDELIAALGALPRQHGLLGAMLETSQPYRTLDIHQHPRFRGWWPAAHPDMRSFLGVPIVSADGVMGAFYLTDKVDGSPFSDADERLIGLLAAHAAIAITNARLYERSRELSILEERNRLALELHDVVSQKLFSLLLTAESAGVLLERGEDAGERVARVGQLARDALEELRSLVHELRPATSSRTASRTLCASTSKCSAGCRAPRSTSSSTAPAGDRRPTRDATARCCASRRRRCTTRCGTRALRASPSRSTTARAATCPSRLRRWGGL